MDIAKSLGPLLEKIEKLPAAARIGICAGILVLVAAPFAYFSYIPKHGEIDTLEKELDKAKADLEIAKKKADKLKTVEKELADLQADFNAAKKELPESDEIPDLLTAISRAGTDAGLEFLLFEPQQAKKKKKSKKKGKGEEEKKPHYVDIPIEIEVFGSYHNIVSFFDKVSKLNRIVNIKDIEIASTAPKGKGKKEDASDINKITASCVAVTYKFTETPKKKPDKK